MRGKQAVSTKQDVSLTRKKEGKSSVDKRLSVDLFDQKTLVLHIKV